MLHYLFIVEYKASYFDIGLIRVMRGIHNYGGSLEYSQETAKIVDTENINYS